jgi:peptidoglycan-associated lipoprotein
MTRLARFAPAALALLSIAALDGCRKKPQQGPTVDTTTTTIPTSATPDADSIRRAREQFVRDSIARANAMSSGAVARARAALTAVVYFDYNSSDLREDSRASLDARVPVLRANAGVRLVIAGHTDERGSTEYNLALGQRRAASVRRYLTDRGISESRLEIVSFGEERPAASGGGESAWQQNRRAEFEISAGGENITAPRP